MYRILILMKRLRLALLLLIVTLSSGCEETNLFMLAAAGIDVVNAVTLDEEDVRAIAAQAAVATDGEHRLAPPHSPYDRRLRQLVAPHVMQEGMSFDFKVYLTDQINAFAMADGTIRIFSGLMDLMTDEELLFVVGHEMGHVLKGHSHKKVRLAYASSAVRKGLASQQNSVGQIAGSALGALAEQLANAQFSQHEERQADDYGVAFLQKGGYDAAAAVSALRKLEQLASRHTFLSSHPDPAERAARLVAGHGTDDEEGGSSLWDRLVELVRILVQGLLRLLQQLF